MHVTSKVLLVVLALLYVMSPVFEAQELTDLMILRILVDAVEMRFFSRMNLLVSNHVLQIVCYPTGAPG